MSTSVSAVAGLISGIVLARTLGPEARGDYATVILWPTLLGILGELGLGFSFSYYLSKNRANVSGLWTIAWVISILWGGLLVTVGSLLLPSMLGLSPALTFYLHLTFLTVPISLATNYLSYLLIGDGAVIQFNWVRLYSALSYSIGIVVVAAAQRSGLQNYSLVYLLSQSTTCLVCVSLVIKRLHPAIQLNVELVRPVFVYGFKTYLSSLAAQANLRLDQTLMTVMVSSEQLGLYVVAVAISSVFSPLYNALATVVLPGVTHALDIKLGGKQIVRYFDLGVLIAMPLTFFAIVLVPWVLPLLFGTEYRRAVPLAQVLLIAAVFQGANIVLGNGLRGIGHPGKPAIAEGSGFLVTVMLLLVLLPVWGAMGAAFASLIAYVFVTTIQLYFVQIETGLKLRDWLSPISSFVSRDIRTLIIRFGILHEKVD